MKKKLFIFIGIFIILMISLILGLLYKKYISTGNAIVEDIYFKNEKGQKIYAKLYRPKTIQRVPIVVYSHGLGATYKAGSYYAKRLLEYNIATLCIDFRGGSKESKSDGKTVEMSIMTEFDDLTLAIKKVRTWDFVDTSKIIVMGSSQGGVLSAMMSVKDKDVKGTVLLYPAFTLPDYLNSRFPTDEDVLDEFPITKRITVGRNYVTDVRGLSLYKLIREDEKKVLIIHGTDDKTVPVNVSETAHKLYKDSELYTIKGAGHGFNFSESDIAIEYVVKYFKKIGIL